MGRRQVIAFDAPAAKSAAASFSAVDREAIGSFNPERISIGTPERSGADGSVSGAMARMRIAPLSVFGCNSKPPRRCSRRSNSRLRRAERGRKRGAPHRQNWRARPPVGGRRPRRTDSRGSVGRSGPWRLRAHFREAKEAPRPARFRAQAAPCRSRRHPFRGEAKPADGSGRRRARNDEYRRVQARSQASAERGLHGAAHMSASFGSAASMAARRLSRNGGSLSASPSASGDSSTAKPGGSVAISNSTRPGSRKYTERK